MGVGDVGVEESSLVLLFGVCDLDDASTVASIVASPLLLAATVALFVSSALESSLGLLNTEVRCSLAASVCETKLFSDHIPDFSFQS